MPRSPRFHSQLAPRAGWIGALACALLALLILISSCAQEGARSHMPESAWAAPVSRQGVESHADVLARVAPAVVTVRSERRSRAARQHPFLDDPMFREFFGDRFGVPEQPGIQRGLGSGVIVNAEGHVLTNHHVVDGAEQIQIELTDGRTLSARLVGSDPPSDLAVLQVTGSPLPALALGNSDQVRVGDVVLAIGNPLGVGQTVTQGIVSAKGRTTGLSDGSFEDFLQTDAAINRGNSGGALINTAGQWIGINSQILSPSGGNIGIGFAIPSNMARVVMDQLVRDGRVRRGQLGVGIQPVTSDLARSLGRSSPGGVIVNEVVPGSAAARAGIQRGDVILSLDGRPVVDSNALRNRVASTRPGSVVTLEIVRDGRPRTVQVTLGELRAENAAADPADRSPASGGTLGLTVQPLTDSQARQLGLAGATRGVLVTAVDPLGPGADAGLQPGDVIEQVDRQSVRSASELRSAVQRAGTRPALLLVHRRDRAFFVTVHPPRS
jgi:Do/DeqQ family serine protease